MIERLEATEKHYLELNEELTKPETLSNINKTKEISKEISTLEEVVLTYRKYKELLNNIDDTKEMVKDPELGEMAKEELSELEKKQQQLEKELEYLLIPKDPNDGKNVIVEIRGAAGGDEANIFAGDLYRMYIRYAESQHYTYEVYNLVEGEAGGFSQIEFMIKGKDAYRKLKYESGSHRVQRVPATESQGRIQTSTATVLVMPEAENIDVSIDEKDIKVDVYRSSGAGGQHVNTTDSAVRITHLPTKIVVTCQNERSQIQNREMAMRMLKNKLYLLEIEKQNQQLSSVKGEHQNIEFGSQIRSYVMHPYALVKDHRSNIETSNVGKVLDGEIDLFIEGYLKGGV